MNFYSKYILPKLLNWGMKKEEFNENREDIAGQARGIVLEIGFGSGYNLPFYKGVEKLYALDPSHELYEYAKERVTKAPFSVEYLQDSAEKIPLADNSIDAVVSTWTLCSIPNPEKALKEIIRVLKPGGTFFFVEHGLSFHRFYSTAQRLLTPFWHRFTGNCHMDREIGAYITNAGFQTENIETFPEPGRPLMFYYKGAAVK